MNAANDPNTISSFDLIRHLWSRRYVMVIAPVVLALSAYFILRFAVSESFTSSARLLVRTPSNELRDGPTFRRMDAPVYEELLLSDALLKQVVSDMDKDIPGVWGGRPFEKIKPGFRVDTSMTRDTTSQQVYSPVIIMSVEMIGQDFTLKVMEHWLKVSLERFGNTQLREATSLEEGARRTYASTSDAVAALEREESTLVGRNNTLGMLLTAKTRLLSGSDSAAVEGESGRDNLGLLREVARLEIDHAEAAARSNAESKDATAGLHARLAKVREILKSTQAEIDTITTERTGLQLKMEDVRRRLVAARESMGELRSVIGASASATLALTDPFSGLPISEVSVISEPVRPEFRSGPARAIIAASMAIAGFVLALLVSMAELYVRRALSEA